MKVLFAGRWSEPWTTVYSVCSIGSYALGDARNDEGGSENAEQQGYMICAGGRIDSASETGCLDTLDISLRSALTWVVLILSVMFTGVLGMARFLTREREPPT